MHAKNKYVPCFITTKQAAMVNKSLVHFHSPVLFDGGSMIKERLFSGFSHERKRFRMAQEHVVASRRVVVLADGGQIGN